MERNLYQIRRLHYFLEGLLYFSIYININESELPESIDHPTI